MSVTPDEPIRPAAWWFGVGAGLIVVGIIAAVVIFAVAFQDTFDEFTEIEDAIDDFQRVPAPGEGDVTITDPGRYTVYVEGSIDVDQTITPPEMTIESTEPDSQPVSTIPLAKRTYGSAPPSDFCRRIWPFASTSKTTANCHKLSISS